VDLVELIEIGREIPAFTFLFNFINLVLQLGNNQEEWHKSIHLPEFANTNLLYLNLPQSEF